MNKMKRIFFSFSMMLLTAVLLIGPANKIKSTPLRSTSTPSCGGCVTGSDRSCEGCHYNCDNAQITVPPYNVCQDCIDGTMMGCPGYPDFNSLVAVKIHTRSSRDILLRTNWTELQLPKDHEELIERFVATGSVCKKK